MNPTERFWAKVDASGDCWVWTGARLTDEHGDYGNAWWERRAQLAHRVAYQLEHGPIPTGLQLDHLCRNRLCVRPTHLEPVTCRENVLRGQGAGAAAARRDTCPEGHVLTAVLGGRDASRHRRRCRPCAAEASRRYRARKAAA